MKRNQQLLYAVSTIKEVQLFSLESRYIYIKLHLLTILKILASFGTLLLIAVIPSFCGGTALQKSVCSMVTWLINIVVAALVFILISKYQQLVLRRTGHSPSVIQKIPQYMQIHFLAIYVVFGCIIADLFSIAYEYVVYVFALVLIPVWTVRKRRLISEAQKAEL